VRTRRGFLAFLTAGAGLAAACGGAATGARPATDAAKEAASAARTLAAMYESALAHGTIDHAEAAAYRAHHLAHLTRLEPGRQAATAAEAAAQAAPAAAELGAAELAAPGTSAADVAAADADLAALLASVGACRALHAQSLGTPSIDTQPPALAVTAKSPDRSAVPALQSVLAAEEAVVFAFGALGPHVTAGRRAMAHAAFDLHRAQRDLLADAIAGRGASPAAAQASYTLPFAVTDAAAAIKLAALVESRLAAVCARAVAASTGDARTYAAWALRQAALRAQTWGAPTAAFPGLSLSA
jgi:hypothetical protein